MRIDIHQNNTNETGTYKIWFTDTLGQLVSRTHSEDEVYELLTDRQYKSFEKGRAEFDVNQNKFHSLGISNY